LDSAEIQTGPQAHRVHAIATPLISKVLHGTDSSYSCRSRIMPVVSQGPNLRTNPAADFDAVLRPFFRRQKSTERAPKEHRKNSVLKNFRRVDRLVSST
jgi:hypothetical protein